MKKVAQPKFVVVEAEVISIAPCPATNPRVDSTEWVIDRAEGGVLFAARPIRVLEVVSQWAVAREQGFLKTTIYLSASKNAWTTKQRLLVLLRPEPVYGGKLAITGQRVRTQVVTQNAPFWDVEINSLDDRDQEKSRLQLSWSRWQVGHLSSKPQQEYSLLLDLKKSCLAQRIIDVATCSRYAAFSVREPHKYFHTNQLSGRIELSRGRYDNGLEFFTGTVDLIAQGNPDLEDSIGRETVRFRIPDGGTIEPLPSE